MGKCMITVGLLGGTEVKNLLANAGDSRDAVQSLSWEDPLEGKMANHSSILAWKIPRTEEPGKLQSMGSQRGTTERLHTHVNHTM